jgi:hypothetical protein
VLFCGSEHGAICMRERLLWRVVMDSKYGNLWGGWYSNEVHGSYEVGLWKNIMKGLGEFASHNSGRWLKD